MLTAIAAATACSHRADGSWKLPFVYRVDIQQGNTIDQKQINKLQPGMDKEQVRFIMGTPLISDPFHPDRWDYLYSMEPGGDDRKQRHITLHFRDNKLSYITGDVEVSHELHATDEPLKEPAVIVPLEEKDEGFFGGLFGKSRKKSKDIDVDEEKAEAYEQIIEETDTEF